MIFFSIASAPPFPGLRRFPEGRNFVQWTGNDSRALMKVRYNFYISTLRSLTSTQGLSPRS